MIYLVSYDLRNQKDYPKLEKKIAELYKVRAKVLLSQWLVESSGTAKEVANLILVGMDADDGILATEMTKRTSWRKLRIPDEQMQKWYNAASP